MALAPASRVAPPRTRSLTVIAKDPSVERADGRGVLTVQVEVPHEELAPGPRGHRVQVIDYDASQGRLLEAAQLGVDDAYADVRDAQRLVMDPAFHAQQVYAVAMSVLARFERALGRRVSWAFDSHQINIAPHAFADTNAFYSRRDHGLLFGYFDAPAELRAPGGKVFTCLAHDVVAHETSHALLDGLRAGYADPTSLDQAAFHEGFADIVALLSMFAHASVVDAGLRVEGDTAAARAGRLARATLVPEHLRRTFLLAIGEQFGRALRVSRGDALRASALLPPSRAYLRQDEFREPHRRGELLVAAVLEAFLRLWHARIEPLGEVSPGHVDRGRVVEEAAGVAERLLTMCIRGLDYAPPVDLEFGDYLSAVLTADTRTRPVDAAPAYRRHLRAAFAAYGIDPSGGASEHEPGLWPEAPALPSGSAHFEALQRDPDEVYRFLWEHRAALALDRVAYCKVRSVRPCLVVAPDGFALRETVAEYDELLDVEARELRRFELRAPDGMPANQALRLRGGGVLIFDEFGRLAYHVRNAVTGPRQQARIDHVWEQGQLEAGGARRFASFHRARALAVRRARKEVW